MSWGSSDLAGGELSCLANSANSAISLVAMEGSMNDRPRAMVRTAREMSVTAISLSR